MEKPPDKITLCHLECVVMPNGEILCFGHSIGWVKTLGKALTPLKVLETETT